MANTENKKLEDKIKIARAEQKSEVENIIYSMEALRENLIQPTIDAGDASYVLPGLKKSVKNLEEWHKKELFYRERFMPFLSELRAAKRFRPKEEPLYKICYKKNSRAKNTNVDIPEISSIYTVDDILNAVCMSLSIEVDAVKSVCRKKSASQARFIAIGLSLRLSSKITLKGLGALLNRDHSSIIYGRDTFNDLYVYDKEFKGKTDKVISQLVAN